MATRQGNGGTQNDIPGIDRVGPCYEPLVGIPPSRKSSIVLLVAMTWDGNEHALLLHDDRMRTFLRGRCTQLGLVSVGEEDAEFQCEELYGLKITRAVFSGMKGVYVLTDDGMLLSRGSSFAGQLGRTNGTIPWNRFGRVPVTEPVVTMAAGGSHVLAASKSKVFAFGSNMFGQAGKPGSDDVVTPRQMDGYINYYGYPRQVACGVHHSVILTITGQVWTCGKGEYTGGGCNTNISTMTRVAQHYNIAFKEVACTNTGTFALGGGVLYGWGLNINGRLGVDFETHNDDYVLAPTVIDCDGRRISTMRCSHDMVVAVTDTGEALFWGLGGPPRLVQPDCDFHREMFSLGEMPDSGGTVFLEWSPDSEDELGDTSAKSEGKSGMTEPARNPEAANYSARVSTWKQAVTGLETTLQDMQRDIDRKDEEVVKLGGNNCHLQQVIHDLQDSNKQQRRTIDELQDSDHQQRLRLGELGVKIVQQQIRIDDLEDRQKQQQKVVDDLQENNNQKQQMLDELQEGNIQKQKRINELEDTINCPICLAKRRGVVFQCGHSACGDCSAQVNSCHNCRNPITARITFFL